MSFIKTLFRKKENPITSYADFWAWFRQHEKEFYNVVKQRGNVEKKFFNRLSPKLNEVSEGIFYLTGMYDDNTVELVLTADGLVPAIVFVEELVDAAPQLDGWKFTALKPALDSKDVTIDMNGLEFSEQKISFYSEPDPEYPDEIEITIVHRDLNDENRPQVTNGVYIYLDNILGELNFTTAVDTLHVKGPNEAGNDLIPVNKLKDYLVWREKEFVEKYEGVRRNTENDTYSIYQGKQPNGLPMIAVINSELLNWDRTASHPWIVDIEMKYDGKSNNGMPDDATMEQLMEIENSILSELKDFEGYLNVGRETAGGKRSVYFACRDFRKPSKVLRAVQKKFSGKEVSIGYDIYKDKYWRSFNHFRKPETANI